MASRAKKKEKPPRPELVAFVKKLKEVCRATHRPEPEIETNYNKEDDKYTSEVMVGNKGPARGRDEMSAEAEGKAAKAWLNHYQPDWEQVLDNGTHGKGELESTWERKHSDEGQEDVELTPPSSPCAVAIESSSRVSRTEKAKGLAALDALSKGEAFNPHDTSAIGGCKVLKKYEDNEWLGKGSPSSNLGSKRSRKKIRSGEREASAKLNCKGVKRKVKVEEGSERRIREMLTNSVKETNGRNGNKALLHLEPLSTKNVKKVVFGSSSTDDAEEEEQARRRKRKSSPSEVNLSKHSSQSISPRKENQSEGEKKVVQKYKSDEKTVIDTTKGGGDTIGGKISPVKSIGKSKTVFGKFPSENEKEEPLKSSFSFSHKSLNQSFKCNTGQKIEPKKTLDGEKERILKKVGETNSEKVSKSAEKKAFTFPSGEKKLKEEQMKRTEKKKNKSGSSTKTANGEGSCTSSIQHTVEATGSDVFDHADDPEVVEIIAKQQQEARALSKRSRGGAGGRKSLARMAERKMCQSEGASSRTKRKLSDSKINKDLNQPTIGKYFSSTKENPHCQDNDQDDEEAGDVDPDLYTPNIDDLLKLPERPDDGSKTTEEILDELDNEIAERHKRHELDRAKVDQQIEEERRKKEERKARFRENAKLRNRLERELTEEKVRGTFRAIIPYLKAIWKGREVSKRHDAYHKSVRTRQALYYTMITDPFTDDQLDWVLEEMSSIWMRNKREQMENNEYIWKVLLPECFIKMYADHFQFSKEEAELRISETPLHKKDRAKIGVEEAEEEEFTQTQGEI